MGVGLRSGYPNNLLTNGKNGNAFDPNLQDGTIHLFYVIL